MKAQDRAS